LCAEADYGLTLICVENADDLASGRSSFCVATDSGRLEDVDGVADTVGGETAAKLLGKVKTGGRFGYASVLPDDAPAKHPAIEIRRVFARPDPSKLREFADDVRDGKFVLPISQRWPLHEAAAAHELLEKGGSGKIVLTI
jgi:NADPH:quinone reductase-like Zn-dependent oxidoreductase